MHYILEKNLKFEIRQRECRNTIVHRVIQSFINLTLFTFASFNTGMMIFKVLNKKLRTLA